jgi:lipase chaperone LimK
LLLAALLIVAVAFSLWRLSANPVAPQSAVPPGAGGADEARTPEAAAGAWTEEGLPPSLVGTVVSGGLRADERGRFVASPDALRLFDYYLRVRGEASEAWIQAQVKREIEARLPASAQASAGDLFVQYLAYLEAAAALGVDGLEPNDMERRLDELRALRRETFGPTTAQLLFEDHERIERVAIERRRVMDDPNLDARERIRRLAELQSQLPEHVQQAEAEAYATLRLARDEDRLRAEGATEAEIQALREEQARADEAQRRDALDRTRQAWSDRMKAYRAERDRVLLNVRSAPEEAKAVFLRRVRERHFEPEEIPRVEALDRIELRDRSLGNAPIPNQP